MLIALLIISHCLWSTRAAPTELHDHTVHTSLPAAWHHEPDHPVHTLFRRAPGDGITYPAVGTPEWSSTFPPPVGPPDPATIPQAWIAALNAAISAGKIPSIPQSNNTVYPPGVNPNSPEVCSSTAKCRIPGDIWDAPDGVFASAFDDGPLQLTPQLVDFLSTNGNLTTTHFMIGVNILYNPTQFLYTFNAGHDIAVHTWSHPYMTTLSNVDIVGQLGWTMQLIHNSTGGRVPRYWRPPYGDSDMRVRAIAKEVFGLETVIWNQDTGDWNSLSQQLVVDAMTRFLTMPKSPGLVVLNHELSIITVGGFTASFPLIAQNGWTWRSLAQVIGGGQVYQNANSSTSEGVSVKGVLLVQSSSSTTTTTTSTTMNSETASRTASSPGRSATGHSSSAERTSHASPFVLISIAIMSLFMPQILS